MPILRAKRRISKAQNKENKEIISFKIKIKTIEKINKTKNQVLEKFMKLIYIYLHWTRTKRQEQITNIRNEREDFTTYLIEIKRMIGNITDNFMSINPTI